MHAGKIVLTILVLGAVGYIVFTSRSQQPLSPEDTLEGTLIFTWNYTPLVEKEIPKTRVSLTATAQNGKTNTKEIAVVDGSCNDYPSPDADVYPHSTMIMCYAAGLGHYFKVVEDNMVYRVMEKIFEEGSPEYQPPQESFHEMAQF